MVRSHQSLQRIWCLVLARQHRKRTCQKVLPVPLTNGPACSFTLVLARGRHGVNRTHVIHARVPGALLLELYSRDGLGTMVSADFYEGASSLTFLPSNP